MCYLGKRFKKMTYISDFSLKTWKYLFVKTIQLYSVFHALSNGVDSTISARSQKFGSADISVNYWCSNLRIIILIQNPLLNRDLAHLFCWNVLFSTWSYSYFDTLQRGKSWGINNHEYRSNTIDSQWFFYKWRWMFSMKW